MENLTFWIGLALSVPLAIIANLITPKIRNLLDTVDERKIKKKIQILESDLKTITNYKDNPAEVSAYLLSIIIKTTFLGAFVGVITGTTVIFKQYFTVKIFPNASLSVNDLFTFFIVIVSISSSLVIFKLCEEGIKTYNRYSNFTEYSERVLKEIEQIKNGTK